MQCVLLEHMLSSTGASRHTLTVQSAKVHQQGASHIRLMFEVLKQQSVYLSQELHTRVVFLLV